MNPHEEILVTRMAPIRPFQGALTLANELPDALDFEIHEGMIHTGKTHASALSKRKFYNRETALLMNEAEIKNDVARAFQWPEGPQRIASLW